MTNRDIICICGSQKFINLYMVEHKRLTKEGHIVISVGVMNNDLKLPDRTTISEIYKDKIDIADRVHILDGHGEMAWFTEENIEYAKEKDIPITYYSEERETFDDEWLGSYPQIKMILDKSKNIYSFEVSSLITAFKIRDIEDGEVISYLRLGPEDDPVRDMIYAVMHGHDLFSIEEYENQAKKVARNINGRIISYGRYESVQYQNNHEILELY